MKRLFFLGVALCISIIILDWSMKYIPEKNKEFWNKRRRCEKGFLWTGTCKDIDECTYNVHFCPAGLNCMNTIGSYKCGCYDGFENIDKVCIDIDECVANVTCPQNGFCQNSDGNYQ